MGSAFTTLLGVAALFFGLVCLWGAAAVMSQGGVTALGLFLLVVWLGVRKVRKWMRKTAQPSHEAMFPPGYEVPYRMTIPGSNRPVSPRERPARTERPRREREEFHYPRSEDVTGSSLDD